MRWHEAFLIKQALAGSALAAKMTRPLTYNPYPKVNTVTDAQTLTHFLQSLPPGAQEVPIRRIMARLRANR